MSLVRTSPSQEKSMIMSETCRIAIAFLNIEPHGKASKVSYVLRRFMSNYMMEKRSKRAGCSHKNTPHNCSPHLSEQLVISDGKKKSMNLNWQISISI